MILASLYIYWIELPPFPSTKMCLWRPGCNLSFDINKVKSTTGAVWRAAAHPGGWLCSLPSGFTASPTPQQPQNPQSLNVDFDSVFGNNTNANNLDSTGEFHAPLPHLSLQTTFILPPRGHRQLSLVHCGCSFTLGKKKYSGQPPIVQVVPLQMMTEVCNFHRWYTSTVRDTMWREKFRKSHRRIF